MPICDLTTLVCPISATKVNWLYKFVVSYINLLRFSCLLDEFGDIFFMRSFVLRDEITFAIIYNKILVVLYSESIIRPNYFREIKLRSARVMMVRSR